MLGVIIKSMVGYTEFGYSESHYAKCHYTECFMLMPIVSILTFRMLSSILLGIFVLIVAMIILF
jgi:hypothetical protein